MAKGGGDDHDQANGYAKGYLNANDIRQSSSRCVFTGKIDDSLRR
jgi:hypothetical protein